MSGRLELHLGDYACQTMHLSTEMHGALWLLTIASVAGKLPDDAAALARAARVSRRRWPQIWQRIARLFERDEDGMLRSTLDIRWYPRSASRPPLPANLRAEVFERDGQVCRYCCTEVGPFEIDHIHPHSRGGSNDTDNLAVACLPCNRSKGARTLEEWLQ